MYKFGTGGIQNQVDLHINFQNILLCPHPVLCLACPVTHRCLLCHKVKCCHCGLRNSQWLWFFLCFHHMTLNGNSRAQSDWRKRIAVWFKTQKISDRNLTIMWQSLLMSTPLVDIGFSFDCVHELMFNDFMSLTLIEPCHFLNAPQVHCVMCLELDWNTSSQDMNRRPNGTPPPFAEA